jgi:transposase-like protein
MQNRSQYWSQHIAAAKFEGLSVGAYAKKNGLGASTLYRWQQRLSSANGESAKGLSKPQLTAAATPVPGKFIALRVLSNDRVTVIKSNVTASQTRAQVNACTVKLPGGIDLQMDTLPEPLWLVALSQCAQGVL